METVTEYVQPQAHALFPNSGSLDGADPCNAKSLRAKGSLSSTFPVSSNMETVKEYVQPQAPALFSNSGSLDGADPCNAKSLRAKNIPSLSSSFPVSSNMETVTEYVQPQAHALFPNSGSLDGANPCNAKSLDIVFLQDATGSQGPYIEAARKAIRDVCDKISAASQLDKTLIRFGLIAFRDHPPQDRSFVTMNFGFTNNIHTMQTNLYRLNASGGGDGPEAQTAALAAALNMDWADNAVKLVILITDAPPHGIGELGDGFSASPDQNDPLVIARQMAERGMALFVIACEPTLSTAYKYAVDFYEALTRITSGQIFPLLLADQLGDYIVGTALEAMETEKLVGQFEKDILDNVYGKTMLVERVAENLQEFMAARGTKINTVVMEEVYSKSEVSTQNQRVWKKSRDVPAARGKVIPVNEPRILPHFLSPKRGSMPPSFTVKNQQVSQSQAERVVIQSIARNSDVTPGGMFSKKSGQEALSVGAIDAPLVEGDLPKCMELRHDDVELSLSEEAPSAIKPSTVESPSPIYGTPCALKSPVYKACSGVESSTVYEAPSAVESPIYRVPSEVKSPVYRMPSVVKSSFHEALSVPRLPEGIDDFSVSLEGLVIEKKSSPQEKSSERLVIERAASIHEEDKDHHRSELWAVRPESGDFLESGIYSAIEERFEGLSESVRSEEPEVNRRDLFERPVVYESMI